jgi:hypothetical protein
MILFVSLLELLFAINSGPQNQLPVNRTGQPDTIKIWNVTADRISADQLGQYYIINSGALAKYNPGGDSVYSWSEPQTGRITLIDAGDPMRILVYQKDFNLLRFLNNRLAPLSGPIRLDDLGLTSPLAFAVSKQGGFWVLDGTTYRIKQIDQELQKISESEPLNLHSATDSSGYQMIESGDRVLLLIPGLEIQVFDLFANLIKRIPLKVPSFNVYGNRILLVYPDKITLWKDPVTPEEILFRLSNCDIREAFLIHNKLLIRTPDKVILIAL